MQVQPKTMASTINNNCHKPKHALYKHASELSWKFADHRSSLFVCCEIGSAKLKSIDSGTMHCNEYSASMQQSIKHGTTRIHSSDKTTSPDGWNVRIYPDFWFAACYLNTNHDIRQESIWVNILWGKQQCYMVIGFHGNRSQTTFQLVWKVYGT